MCCGQSTADLIARQEMGDFKVTASAGNVLLFTAVRGMSIDVPPHGSATNYTPVEVPAAVAEQLREDKRFSTEQTVFPPAEAPPVEEAPPSRRKSAREGKE